LADAAKEAAVAAASEADKEGLSSPMVDTDDA
jgi:hypothetical protein